MGLFDKLQGPVFFKDDSDAEQQLSALQNLRQKATGKALDAIDDEIRRVKAGIYGEKQIHFELEHSHIPMYILHDLFFEYDGLTAQIDYLIITRKHNYVIECKNLYGNIEIDKDGNFYRLSSYGRVMKKEGFYSPVTQNRRHMDLIKQMRSADKNIITRFGFERFFYEIWRSVVVLTNEKTVLNNRYAPDEIRNQVIRADQLAAFIRKTDDDPSIASGSDKDMKETAQVYLSYHREPIHDYTKKYRDMIRDLPVENKAIKRKSIQNDKQDDSAVFCPKCGAPMRRLKVRKGPRAGKEMYGCSNYPQCSGVINIE